MPANPDQIVAPLGAVYEHLGLVPAPNVEVPTRLASVNIRRLNIKDAGPAQGTWVDRNAVLMWMRLRSEEAGGVPVLEKMIAELAEVTI